MGSLEEEKLRMSRCFLNEGKRCMKLAKWDKAALCLYSVQGNVEEFSQLGCANLDMHAKITSHLLEAGINLNTMMKTKSSLHCYETVMTDLFYYICDYNKLVVSNFERALQSYINTLLLIQEVQRASDAVVRWAREILETEFSTPLDTTSPPIYSLYCTVAHLTYTVSQAQIELGFACSAITTLSMVQKYLNEVENDRAMKILKAKTTAALGYCSLKSDDEDMYSYLEQSVLLWKELDYPLEEITSYANALKYNMEALYARDYLDEDACKNVEDELMYLQPTLQKLGYSMYIADIFTFIGTVAFHKDKMESNAVYYFEKSLELYKQGACTTADDLEIQKLLRFIGVANYNCRNYKRAAQCYRECLDLLEKVPEENRTSASTEHIADCCASLGFTHSRLRDFDNMLKYYQKALSLGQRLAREDLELIETNMGSLYFVKAVQCNEKNEPEKANDFYDKAEVAFHHALRYSWKSFPFINYGYYILCRGRFQEAAGILRQGYLNGIIDKDTVEFDHTEDPILLEDLKNELHAREDIRMPSPIIALYLKTLAEIGACDMQTAGSTALQLKEEVVSTAYNAYYTVGYGEDRMKALCYSLVGYAFKSLGCYSNARQNFEHALRILPTYQAAGLNIEKVNELETVSTMKRKKSAKK